MRVKGLKQIANKICDHLVNYSIISCCISQGVELGMQLSELPLTQQSAPEVTRLYLSSNVSVPTADEGKELQGIVDSLQDKEFYALHAVEKLKVRTFFESIAPMCL